MTTPEFIFFCLGCSLGASLMWWHFIRNDLIRTRDEWYAAHPEHRPKKEP